MSRKLKAWTIVQPDLCALASSDNEFEARAMLRRINQERKQLPGDCSPAILMPTERFLKMLNLARPPAHDGGKT